MKQVTVKDQYLNVRQGQPSLNATTLPPLAPGTVVTVEDQLYNGDAYNGINTWYKDQGGNFLWSGDVGDGQQVTGAVPAAAAQPTGGIIPTTTDAISAFQQNATFPPAQVNWNSRIVKLPVNIRNCLGTGIRVSVLDSGVEKTHMDLAQNLVFSKDYTGAAAGDDDIRGHGTEMASLIAASPFFEGKGVMGVAPGAKLYSGKVQYDLNNPLTFESLKTALGDTATIKPDIVNMSFGQFTAFPVPADNQLAILTSITQQSNTIFFAATPEPANVDSPGDLLQMFPSNQSVVIPVCALPQDKANALINNITVPMIIVPEFDASCCSDLHLNYYNTDNGSSISTALISGIMALLLASDPSIGRDKNSVLQALSKYSSTIAEAYANPGPQVHFIVKIINQ